jgi:hypothetical protein
MNTITLQNQIDDIDRTIELLVKQIESLRGSKLNLRRELKSQRIIEAREKLFNSVGKIKQGDSFLHGDNILVCELEYDDSIFFDFYSKNGDSLDKPYIVHNNEEYYYMLSGGNKWNVLNFDNLLEDSVPLSEYTRI